MKNFIHQRLAIGSAALAWSTQAARADSDGSSTLSGDWGGLRRHWTEQGANFEAVYTADVIANRRGGIERGTKTLGNLDIQLTLDGAKLFNRPGLTLFLYGLDNPGDGALLVAEAGLRYPGAAEGTLDRRYSLGAWHYTAKFDDLLDTNSSGQPIQQRNNQGLYAIAESALYHEPGDAAQGLNAFCRFGLANADINILRSYLGFGLVYTGLFNGQPQDKISLGLAHAMTGEKYRRLTALSGIAADNAVSAVELSYRAIALDWLVVQPDLQYIINPGADPALDNALVLGTRFEITL